MTRRKVEVRAVVRINAHRVLSDAVDRAVGYGVQHAQKHWPKPLKPEQSAAIEEEVRNAVMNELSDVLLYGDGQD